MSQMTERRAVALAGAAATFLFWIEYLPPFKRLHLFGDIEGYHWPLLMYAFSCVRHFRFPLWDASIYCGIPFAGNIQAALFYPGTWVLFLANLGQPHLRFKILEMYVFAHCWLGFYLCYRWLRGRGHSPLAALLGGFGFGFSGYMMSQMHHAGMVTGYVWTPLAWRGIDEAAESRSARPLWKVTAALAMVFLAGYPGGWVAACAATAVYAFARHWRVGLQTIGAMALMLPLVAVQLLPVAEAAGLKVDDPKFGYGVKEPLFYVSLALPNYFDFSRNLTGGIYLYLGAPVLFGLLFAARRSLLPAFAVLAVCFAVLYNPFDIVRASLEHIYIAYQMVTPLNFIEPATLAFALIAATGVDACLKRPARLRGRTFILLSSVFCFLYSAVKLYFGLRGGLELPSGWWSAADPAILLVLLWLALAVFRSATGLPRLAAAAAICLMVFVDFKVYGTNRAFNRMPGDADEYQPRGVFPGVDNAVFDRLKANRHYRIAVGELPHSTDLRKFGLATPQGFDPLLPAQYKQYIEGYRKFRTNRLFDIHPSDDGLLQTTGVRYFAVRTEDPLYPVVNAAPGWRFLGGPESFYRLYEYTRAQPPWKFEGDASITMTKWEPERRDFRLDARTAGRFVLAEQFYPGWEARIDGRTAPVQRWKGTFQSVMVPPGAHEISFRYRPRSLLYGALISFLTLFGLPVARGRANARRGPKSAPPPA